MICPNAHERKALQVLGMSEWEHEAKLLPAGPGTIAGMLQKGWIERLPDTLSGQPRYKITAAGRAACDVPAPQSAHGRKVTILTPRGATLNTFRNKPAK